MMRHCTFSAQLTQRGVGLLEVMIALLVLSIGALGFAGLQLKSLSNSNEANFRAQAILIVQDAIERFQSNPGEMDYYFDESNWPIPSDADLALLIGAAPPDWVSCITGACTSEEMADWDIDFLRWTAANTLPGGRMQAGGCAFNTLDCLTISWNEQNIANCTDAGGINAGGADDSCIVVEVSR